MECAVLQAVSFPRDRARHQKRTDCSLNVKESGGGPSHQVRWLCRKHRGTSDGMKASPAYTSHACLTTDLSVRFLD